MHAPRRYSFLGTSDSAADLMRQFGVDQGQPREPPEPPPGAPVFRPPAVASDGFEAGLSLLGRPPSVALSAPFGGEQSSALRGAAVMTLVGCEITTLGFCFQSASFPHVAQGSGRLR